MANTYVNFDLASGGDGSSGNPYGVTEFKTHYPTDIVTWQARGSWNDPSYTLDTSINLTIEAWDSVLYGPFRFNIYRIYGREDCIITLTGGIGNVIYGLEFPNPGHHTTAMLFLTRCFLNVSGTNGIIFANVGTNIIYVFYSTLICKLQGWSLYTRLYYSTIDILYIGGSSGGGGGASTNCVMSKSIGWLNGWKTGCGPWTDFQYSWAPPVWPAWNDIQSSFANSVLSLGESGINPITTPPEPGDLSVTGLWGEARTGIGGFYFDSAIAPVADFAADMTSVMVGQTVTFTDLSLNTPTSWLYNFGDSTTSILQNPTHAYGSVGSFTVDLTATNIAGSDTSTKTNYISVTPAVLIPVADFTADTTYAAVGQTVNFTDLSLNTPTSWTWAFGDSTSSVLQNPTHAYSTAGLFTVSLDASNSAGSDSSTKTDYIETVAETPYGLGMYGTGGYKGQGGTGSPELHYYALKKIMPYALTGDLDDDLHIEGKYLDQCYYLVGGSDPQSPYSDGGLLPEFFGDTVDQLLASWRRIFDLETSATSADVVASQYLLAHKDGQLTKSNFIALSADLGFTIDPIYEGLFDMFIIGDALTLIPQPASQLPHKIYDVEHIWHWYITVTAGSTDATVRARYEARINELKPGFTQVHFTYL